MRRIGFIEWSWKAFKGVQVFSNNPSSWFPSEGEAEVETVLQY